MEDPWEAVDRAGDWLVGIASEFQPDIVHLNGYCHAALPWPAPVLIVAHSCVISWWFAVKNEPLPSRFQAYRERVAVGLSAADFVIAPTKAMLDSLVENYSVFPRGRVISNARDARLFSPGQKLPRVFAAGRIWDEAKNIAALEAAAPLVRWPVEVAGNCNHPNGARTQMANIRCLGILSPERIAEHLAASAIFASAARYEPFGLSALEAGLSGCALVLGDIPSLREVWGNAALFVAPDDHAALADALNDLIENEMLRAELSRRARMRALEFSPQKMAEAYLAAYRECVQEAEGAAA